MAGPKIKLKEGQIFAVPIEKKFVAGVIARYVDDGILGYFFNKVYDTLPKANEIGIDRTAVIYIVKAGAMGLKNGFWRGW